MRISYEGPITACICGVMSTAQGRESAHALYRHALEEKKPCTLSAPQLEVMLNGPIIVPVNGSIARPCRRLRSRQDALDISVQIGLLVKLKIRKCAPTPAFAGGRRFAFLAESRAAAGLTSRKARILGLLLFRLVPACLMLRCTMILGNDFNGLAKVGGAVAL